MQNTEIKILELIKKIEADKFKHIDSRMLSNFVKMVCQLGLKKREVLKLKIKDVIDESGEVVKQIDIGRRKMTVSPEVEAIIKGQIDYLTNNDNYNADRNSPLFQSKKGIEYSEAARQLRRKFNSLKLEKIRQHGLKAHYESLKNLSDLQRLKEMKKFTDLSDKEINGILKETIQKPGTNKAAYEKDSYMDEVIDRLQNHNGIDLSDFLAIPEKINEFDLDDMSKVERLINAFFNAVDNNVSLNKDGEGIDEATKANSKRILKKSLLERFCHAGIVFDPETKKAKKDPKSEESEEDRASMSVFEAKTGKKPDTKIYNIPTDKNQMEAKTSEIQSDKEIFVKWMDSKFKVDIHILFDNCNLDLVKSYASQLLTRLIDQLPVEISDRKLPEKDRGITQESFQILIGGKIKNISSQSTEKPFPNYNEMVKYLAREGSVYSHHKKLNNDQIYLIERDILLNMITLTWNRFTENERKIFYLGLLDNEHFKKFRQYLPFQSHWSDQFFKYTLFEELFGSSSPVFLKIAALIVNSTYFYHFNEDIPLKLDKTHRNWRDSFRDKIIKTIGQFPYGEARMAMLGCISCICLLRQIEFLKDKGISFENTMAFQVDPAKVFFL